MKWREVAFFILVGYNYDGKPVTCFGYTDFNLASQSMANGSVYGSVHRLFLIRVDKEDDNLITVTLVAEKQ